MNKKEDIIRVLQWQSSKMFSNVDTSSAMSAEAKALAMHKRITFDVLEDEDPLR